MLETKIHFFSNEPLVALLGNPNCGKTALFNLLTGSRQKVANYSGVTVERKAGRLTLASGKKDRKSTRLNSSHTDISRMPSSA